jgi:hypothetical protein
MSQVQFSSASSTRDNAESPLTHHEIMRLVRPFSDRGYRVDLDNSDRARRCVQFRPVTVDAVDGAHPALTSTLCLQLPRKGKGKTRLTRTLTAPGGLAARAVAEGDTPAAMLHRIEALPPARQMRLVAERLLACSYAFNTLGSTRLGGDGASTPPAKPRLTSAEVSFGAMTMTFKEGIAKAPWEITLSGPEGQSPLIPEDLLAVLGWCWRPLRKHAKDGWRGTVKLPPREPARTQTLEALLDDAINHLTETFADGPAHFHERHRGSRWRVAFQRVLPLVTGTLVIGGVVALALLLPKTQTVHVFMLHLPPLLMILFFTQNEIPTMEIPPIPRPLTQKGWLPGMVGGAPAARDVVAAGTGA